jgi:hypothetical protein
MMKSYMEPIRRPYWDDMEWVRKHHSELYRRFGIHDAVVWIAVCDKKVVAHGLDPGEVERIAVEKTGKPAEDIFITFLVGASMIL